MEGTLVDHVTRTEFSLLKQEVTGIREDVVGLKDSIDAFVNSRQTNPWRLVAMLLAILIPLGFILNLYITSAIAPVASVANQAKAVADGAASDNVRQSEDLSRVKAQTADSERDRSGLRIDLGQTMARQNDNRERMAEEISTRKANEREMETQIDAVSQALGIQFANQQRQNNGFQAALHDVGAKVPAPTDGPYYFPNISNRNHNRGNE